MENYKKQGLMLISGLALSNSKNPAVVKYTPGKTKILSEEAPSLKRARPEAVGIPSSLITTLIEDLEADSRANIHSMVIVKDGQVITECARKGYSARLPHLSHSMSKTVTGIVIGMLIDDNLLSLDDTLEELFPEYDIHPEAAKITVKNLMIMSSGIAFSEIGAVTDERWTETFLASEPSFAPGEKFAYNSMNSYMLMVIATRIISREYGLGAEEFLKIRLFKPLGISEYLWESGPEDIIKGGWGLYLSAESYAKLGMMMLSGGEYDGKRILSESFVTAATSTQIKTPEETGDFNYGYQLWVARSTDEFLFNGMLGQNVLVIPKRNIVVSINSANNELFQESPALRILRTHLSADLSEYPSSRSDEKVLKNKTDAFYNSRLAISPKAQKRGFRQLLGLTSRTPFDSSFLPLTEAPFIFTDNNQGILPLFVRVMQNNYQGGISKFEFTKKGEELTLTSYENDAKYEYKIGFYDYKFTELDYCGEKYTVGAIARFVGTKTSPDYEFEFIFPELPNSRFMRLSLSQNGMLKVEMAENPNSNIAKSFIESIPAMSPKITFALNMLESNLGKNFIQRRFEEVFAPTIFAVSEDSYEFEALLENENRKVNDKLSSFAMVRMLLSKFTGSDENEERKAPSLGGMFLSSILGKFFS